MCIRDRIENDEQYDEYGLVPPSIGYKLIHGPVVPGMSTDTANINLQSKAGYKNLEASSFGYFVAGGAYSDPGPYGTIEGAREYYNLMRGYAPIDDLTNPTAWVNTMVPRLNFPFQVILYPLLRFSKFSFVQRQLVK